MALYSTPILGDNLDASMRANYTFVRADARAVLNNYYLGLIEDIATGPENDDIDLEGHMAKTETTTETTDDHIQIEELDEELATKAREELGDEKIIEMLRSMVLQRRFEQHAGRAYQRRKIKGFCHLYSGQEAVAVGSMTAATDDDYVVTHYREHGHALARGMEPNGVMAELFGKKTGCAGGRGGSMHLYDVERNFLGGWGIVGGQIALGNGVAFAAKYRDEEAVCLSYLGDGAIHQGIVHETLNMAALWNLPLIAIVENNEYAMGTALERVSAVKELEKKALSYDMASETVDGQDVFAVWDAISRARKRAVTGEGPTWLDVRTYRYHGHSMTDPATYRTKEEVDEVRDLRDPIVRLRNWLVNEDILTQEDIDAIDDEMEKVVKDSVKFADESDFPDVSTLTDNVYVEWPAEID